MRQALELMFGGLSGHLSNIIRIGSKLDPLYLHAMIETTDMVSREHDGEVFAREFLWVCTYDESRVPLRCRVPHSRLI